MPEIVMGSLLQTIIFSKMKLEKRDILYICDAQKTLPRDDSQLLTKPSAHRHQLKGAAVLWRWYW